MEFRQIPWIFGYEFTQHFSSSYAPEDVVQLVRFSYLVSTRGSIRTETRRVHGAGYVYLFMVVDFIATKCLAQNFTKFSVFLYFVSLNPRYCRFRVIAYHGMPRHWSPCWPLFLLSWCIPYKRDSTVLVSANKMLSELLLVQRDRWRI